MIVGIAVMAKAPHPGRTKTRLCPAVAAETAAMLGAAFLQDVIANLGMAAAQRNIASYVAFAPAGTEHLLRTLLPSSTNLLLADGELPAPPGVTGFGRCLLHATEAMFDLGHDAACVLNADSPTLPTRLLIDLHDRLAAPGDRIVLGPAEDGGYYVLGMKDRHHAMFADIEWSTAHVAAETRAQAARLGIECMELEPWYDVDEPVTLDRLIRDLHHASTPCGQFLAPHTRACLTSCGLFEQIKATEAAA